MKKAQKITIEQLAAAEELIAKHHLAPTVVTDFTVRVQLDDAWMFYVKGNNVDVENAIKYAESNYNHIYDKISYLTAMVFSPKKITKSKQFINCMAALEIVKAAQKCGFVFEIAYTDNRNLHLF